MPNGEPLPNDAFGETPNWKVPPPGIGVSYSLPLSAVVPPLVKPLACCSRSNFGTPYWPSVSLFSTVKACAAGPIRTAAAKNPTAVSFRRMVPPRGPDRSPGYAARAGAVNQRRPATWSRRGRRSGQTEVFTVLTSSAS